MFTKTQSQNDREIQIVGMGRYLPETQVSGLDMDLKLGLPPGTSTKLTGVENRYYATSETAAEMGAHAALDALRKADLRLEDVDAIVGASGTPDQIIPCNSALILEQLELRSSDVSCFDINSTCLSFVTALDFMSYAISAGRFRTVLVVSSDISTRGLNPRQIEAYALFGDGAAAAVLRKSPAGGASRIIASKHSTFYEGSHTCEIRGGGTRKPAKDYTDADKEEYLFSMSGRKVFKLASQHILEFSQALLKEADYTMNDIDLVIPHQASLSAVELMRRKLGVAEDRIAITVQRFGNTIASSIPLALEENIRIGRVNRGDKVLLLGTSAGFSIGGLIFEF